MIKILLITILAFFLTESSFTQTYTMSNDNVNTCSGTFYDDGVNSDYSNDATYTYTVCSNTPAAKLEVLFTMFDTESGFDELCIYDGASTASPLIGCFSGNGLSGQQILASGACLTFDFTADGSVTRDGWEATISCKLPCQDVVASVGSVLPLPAGVDNHIPLCVGGQVTLSGSAVFPQNNTYYSQTLANTKFRWLTGNGLQTLGQNATVTYNSPGMNGVYLIVEDVEGCADTVKVGIASVSLPPSFSDITFTNNDTICLDEDVTISIAAKTEPVVLPDLEVGSTTFLPDGNGVSYTTSIDVDIFDPAAIFEKGFLKNIFLEIEHSYLGDLEMKLICPNSQEVILKSYLAGGGGTHLGEPIDLGGSTAAGVGYLYNFTNSASVHGTMSSESGNFQHTYTDLNGNNYNNQDYLPAGDYLPFESIDDELLGCPLNGSWTLEVTDEQGLDDGYIFQWGFDFNEIILPDVIGNSILPQITSKIWSPDPTITANPNDSTIRVLPLAAGDFSYTFNITDDFGCSHDTTISIHVKPRPTSNAGVDEVTCNLTHSLSPIATPGASSASWTYYSNSGTGSNIFSDPSDLNTDATVDEYTEFGFVLNEMVNGCQTYSDTVIIDFVALVNTIDIGITDDTVCLPNSVDLVNNSDMTQFDDIQWDLGDGTIINSVNSVSHNYVSAQCYDVKITLKNTVNGCEIDSVLTNFACLFDLPEASFNFLPYEPLVPETDVTFSNTSTGNMFNYWDFGGIGSSTVLDPTFTFPQTEAGDYLTKLVVENVAGCKDSTTSLVVVKNTLSIFIPNAFSPNNDGYNDFFEPILTNDDIEDYSIRIFDRWGNTMFYSEELDFSWDGKYNGEKSPIGTYIYQIKGKELLKTDPFKIVGHVSIIK